MYTAALLGRLWQSKRSINAVEVLREAEIYFNFKIHSEQTDNGSGYRGDFHDWCTNNDIPHYFIPKSSPVWNGCVERVHKTVDDEYYHNPLRQWTSRWEWLRYYNFEKIHLGLNGLTPHEAYLKSVTLEC